MVLQWFCFDMHIACVISCLCLRLRLLGFTSWPLEFFLEIVYNLPLFAQAEPNWSFYICPFFLVLRVYFGDKSLVELDIKFKMVIPLLKYIQMKMQFKAKGKSKVLISKRTTSREAAT